MLFYEADRMLRDESGVIACFNDRFLIVPPVHPTVLIDMRMVVGGFVKMTDELNGTPTEAGESIEQPDSPADPPSSPAGAEIESCHKIPIQHGIE